MAFIPRILPIEKELKRKSVLLLGPRRTGKSALLRHQIKADQSFDLLKADTFQNLSFRPSAIREGLHPGVKLIVIDEIQKLPNLMDEVHAIIEEHQVRFILTGSSARKIKRTHTSLMAGRAHRMNLHPFCYPEIKNHFHLNQALHLGTLPAVFMEDSNDAWRELCDYSGDYIREEILAEALVRKIESFSRFLPVASRMNGELLNFESLSSDSQVPARTVREYYALLEDTLIGRTLEPLRFKGANSRKAIATSKFYFFDNGVVNALQGRKTLSDNTPEYDVLFETWIHNEIRAYIDYFGKQDELRFWRSPTGQEVDFVINREIGIEVKSNRNISERHLDGLNALHSISQLKTKIIVSRDRQSRKLGDVKVMPWKKFIEDLWAGKII